MPTLPRLSNRFVGIVPEQHQWPEESRIWPNLGINYVGTAAKRAGYDVVLHDEFIQGYAPLETLIREGDVVGLSLVVTGMKRGVEIARRAKALGARYVIVGNDSAIFRAPQLLALPGKPIDAVFTSNSVISIRQFLLGIRKVPIESLRIPHVSTDAMTAPVLSNNPESLAWQKANYAPQDFFMAPDLSLFGRDYWEIIWRAYRNQFGHKHRNPHMVKNAVALLAQGCGRAAAGEACDYCSIGGGLGNVVIPDRHYLEQAVAVYRDFGVDMILNPADSSIEMIPLAESLAEIGPLSSLSLYGRAQVITGRILDKWNRAVDERILINCGMDSGDDFMLRNSVNKTARKTGSPLEENRRALRAMRAAGEKIHGHFSVVLGGRGETRASCDRTVELIDEAIDVLGPTGQLDLVEGDQWWVNYGAPCAQIFDDYNYAKRMAESVGKEISLSDWRRDFQPYADELVVPESCQDAWYRHFTDISIEIAHQYVDAIQEKMSRVPGAVTGRRFNFMPG